MNSFTATSFVVSFTTIPSRYKLLFAHISRLETQQFVPSTLRVYVVIHLSTRYRRFIHEEAVPFSQSPPLTKPSSTNCTPRTSSSVSLTDTAAIIEQLVVKINEFNHKNGYCKYSIHYGPDDGPISKWTSVIHWWKHYQQRHHTESACMQFGSSCKALSTDCWTVIIDNDIPYSPLFVHKVYSLLCNCISSSNSSSTPESCISATTTYTLSGLENVVHAHPSSHMLVPCYTPPRIVSTLKTNTVMKPVDIVEGFSGVFTMINHLLDDSRLLSFVRLYRVIHWEYINTNPKQIAASFAAATSVVVDGIRPRFDSQLFWLCCFLGDDFVISFYFRHILGHSLIALPRKHILSVILSNSFSRNRSTDALSSNHLTGSITLAYQYLYSCMDFMHQVYRWIQVSHEYMQFVHNNRVRV